MKYQCKNPTVHYGRSEIKNDRKIAAQEKRCREYAENHRMTIIKCFADNGAAGKIKKRQGLCKLLNFISENEVDYLIVDDFSCLSRNPDDFQNFREILSEHKVKLIAVQREAFFKKYPAMRILASQKNVSR